MIDYRKFRFSKLNTPEFSHLKLLLFWPIFGLVFLLLERGFTDRNYVDIYCSFDDLIPFCEWFIIPYYIWFAFLVGMMLYSLLFDVKAFKNYIYFTMITYAITSIVYIVFPNAQALRPIDFPRDNILTDIVRFLYDFDTNTNVCPSIHVIGSVAVFWASWNAKHLKKPGIRTIMLILTILISLSTVFLKQHSIIDVIAAIPVCLVAYPFVYCPKFRYKFFSLFKRKRRKSTSTEQAENSVSSEPRQIEK